MQLVIPMPKHFKVTTRLLPLLLLCSITAPGQNVMQLRCEFKGFGNAINPTVTYFEPTVYAVKDTAVPLIKATHYYVCTTVIQNPAVQCAVSWHSGRKKYSKYFLLDSGLNHITFSLIKGRFKMQRNYSATDSLQRVFHLINDTNIDHLITSKLFLIRNNPSNFSSLIHLAELSRFAHRISADSLSNVLSWLDTSLRQTPLGIEMAGRLKKRKMLQTQQPLPALTFNSVAGEAISIQQLPPKWYLIAFSASWCSPCKERIPLLKTFTDRYPAHQFQIIYLNLDTNLQKWQQMIKQYATEKWINLTDTVGMRYSETMRNLDIALIPQYLLVNDKWNIVYNSMQESDVNLDKLSAVLKKALSIPKGKL